LQKPEFVGDFFSLFRRLAIRFAYLYVATLAQLTPIVFRTTKSMVRDELGIPEQKRYLVPIELGRVEKLVSAHHDHSRRLSDGVAFSSTIKTWKGQSSP
jgi:hypothetical protein